MLKNIPVLGRESLYHDYEEVTLANIETACKKHFASVIVIDMLCDILAGEQGPSCSSVYVLDQIPDMRVVYIRFNESAQSYSATSGHEAADPVHTVESLVRESLIFPLVTTLN